MRSLFLIVTLLISSSIYAQNDPLFTSEGQRSFWFNPASTGTLNYYGVAMTNRLRFTGTEVVPHSLNVNASYKGIRITKRSNKAEVAIGSFGVNYNHDRNFGLTNNNLVLHGNLQFKLRKTFISFGIAPGVHQVTLDPDFFVIDPFFGLPPLSQTKYTIGVGTQWFNEKFSLGFSTTHASEENLNKIGFKLRRHFYFNGSYTMQLTRSFKLRAIGVARSTNSFTTASIMVYSVFAKNELSLGVGYRDGGNLLLGLSGRLGKFYLGYFIDKQFSPLSIGYISHEVRLAFELFDAGLMPSSVACSRINAPDF